MKNLLEKIDKMIETGEQSVNYILLKKLNEGADFSSLTQWAERLTEGVALLIIVRKKVEEEQERIIKELKDAYFAKPSRSITLYDAIDIVKGETSSPS